MRKKDGTEWRTQLCDRWIQVIDRAKELHYTAPWIYSDTWLNEFLNEMDEAYDCCDNDALDETVRKWWNELM